VFFIPTRVDNSTTREAVLVGGTYSEVTSRPEHVPFPGFSFSNSLYGSFALYLENSGYNVSTAENVDSIDFDNADVIFLIMYNIAPNYNANALREFVQNGGRLVVVGDHTNIFQTTAVKNELISFSRLRLEDDTTDDLLFASRRNIWDNSLYTLHNPLFINQVRQEDFQVWGGASVRSSSLFSVPLLIGRYATSDPPDLTNVGFGGYLGNRRFDYGERAGDMPLIKAISYGNGTVIVFGDSSYFQTPVVASNWRYLSAIIEYTPESRGFTALRLVVLLLVCAVFLFMAFRKIPIQSNILYYSSITLVVSAMLVAMWNANVSRRFHDNVGNMRSERFMYISDSFFNNINACATHDNSIVGLAYNAIKSGIPAMIGSDLTGGAMFIINPNRNMSQNEQREILSYIRNGGIVVGAMDRAFAPHEMLNYLGVNITTDFLGPVPWRYPMMPETMRIDFPDFKRAWRLEVTNDSRASSWLDFNGDTLITRSIYGNGLFYFIADENFLDMVNIEEERTGNMRNIALLKELFNEINAHFIQR